MAKKDNKLVHTGLLQAEALGLITKQLMGIREELHQANKLTLEKQKADLDGILTKAEKELIRGAV